MLVHWQSMICHLRLSNTISNTFHLWPVSSYGFSTNSTSAAWSEAWSLSKLLNAASCLVMSSHELAADPPPPPRESAVQQLPPEQQVNSPGETDTNSDEQDARGRRPEDDEEGQEPVLQNKRRNLRGEGGHAIRSGALKRKIDELRPELQNAVLALKQITKHCATATAFDHRARRNHAPIGTALPPLTKDCLQCLSTLPSASWRSEAPWRKDKQGSREGSAAGCAGAGSEAGGGGGNAGPATGDDPNGGQPKPNDRRQLKVTEEVYTGLSRLADRLGYVWGSRSVGKAFEPNINALLAGLGTGEAFNSDSVLGRSLLAILHEEITTLESKVNALLQNLNVFQEKSRSFAASLSSFVGHPENADPRKNPTWPNIADFSQELVGPAKRMELPSDIGDVFPEEFQKRVADTIRKRMNALTEEFVTQLCDAYGYDNPEESGCDAVAWQFGAQKRSRSVTFAAPQFCKSCVKCPALKRHIVKAVSERPEHKKTIFRRWFPDPRQEIFMMAATGTTYRSRIGYKKLCPWGAWHGPAKAVETKHQIFDTIKKTIPLRPSADGWFASIRSIIELEFESLICQTLFSLEAAENPEAVCPPAAAGPPDVHGTVAATAHVCIGIDGRVVTKKSSEVEGVVRVVLPDRPYRGRSARELRTFAIWQGHAPPICHIFSALACCI